MPDIRAHTTHIPTDHASIRAFNCRPLSNRTGAFTGGSSQVSDPAIHGTNRTPRPAPATAVTKVSVRS